MNFKDYKFNIGDEVITIYGEKGKIVEICDCERCQARGFCEPVWVEDNDEYEIANYITDYQAENGFNRYFKIGKYRFNSFNKEHVLNRISYHEDKIKKYKKRLKVIEEYVDPIDKAIEHFRHGIDCDYFNEEVASYAKLAIEALEKYKGEMDMPVKVSCGNSICNATGVGTIVDIDTDTTSVDIYADYKE